MFIQPRPAAPAMDAIYPSNYYAYHESKNENAFTKRFRDRMEEAKVRRYEEILRDRADTIVDVGCGDGRLLEIHDRFVRDRLDPDDACPKYRQALAQILHLV